MFGDGAGEDAPFCPGGFALASPGEEHPQEQLLRRGAQALSDAELLAVLLGLGQSDPAVTDLARKMLCEQGGLAALVGVSPSALRHRGLDETKICALLANLELACRLARSEVPDREPIIADTLERFAATGSPVLSDGEQTKPSFATYPVHGATNLAPDGAVIPFADGHTRQLPRLTAGPFRYVTRAGSYLDAARRLTDRPLKQAVISASALSLLYPQDGIDGYSREEFLADLVDEAAADIRSCLDRGAHAVQIDFTEGRLACKLDPSGGLLESMVGLNNQVLARFSAEERRRLGVHTCPGGDHDSTHSADVDYAELLPALFSLEAGNFYVQLASEADRWRSLGVIRDAARPGQRVFVGVIDPLSPRVETAEEVRDRVLEAAKFIPLDRLGTTDDCGFSPFADDTSTSRDVAFAKIRARVEGTALAAAKLGL